MSTVDPSAQGDESSRGRGRRGVSALLRRFPLLLGAFAGIGVCALSLLLLSLLRGQASTPAAHLPAPGATAQAICADLQRQDYAALYSRLTSGLRTEGTAAQFVASQRQLDIALGTVTHCTAIVTGGDTGQASVQFTLTRGRGAPTSATGHLTYEGGAWRLDAYDAQLVRATLSGTQAGAA